MAVDQMEKRGNVPVRDKNSKAHQDHRLHSLHQVLYDAVGQLSPDLSEEAFSTLCDDARSLELNPWTLNFRQNDVEAEFQQHVAIRRRPILMLVFCFDISIYLFRMASKFVNTRVTLPVLVKGMMPQICNMIFLHTFLALLNRRSRRLGQAAARQEELLLTGVMTLAICSLLVTITKSNPQDYVYAAMFMISTTCFLKIQWLVGTVFMIVPLFVTRYWHRATELLPLDAETHLAVSWAVGGFMAYLSDTYRRQMFVNHRLAKVAAEKELQQAQARINVQQQLSVAQQQAAQRTITVAREKAANEAKSEFMSLMCHEVRTPLNGCLASAEMLLEMPLQEEQRELAKTIRVSGSILLSTVSNFLDFFKMEAGKQLDVVRTEMNTQELVGDIHCIIEATIGRSADVVLDKPNTDGVPKYVLGDPDRLRGILLNLYTNAAKFTKRGSIALRVRVAGPGYRPSPAQVLAQQQRGPHPLQSMNKNSGRDQGQTGAEAGEALARSHRVLVPQDRSNPSGTSPFLSNALAIPHMSHTASAMRGRVNMPYAEQPKKALTPSPGPNGFTHTPSPHVQSQPLSHGSSAQHPSQTTGAEDTSQEVSSSSAGAQQAALQQQRHGAEADAQATLLNGQQAHDAADTFLDRHAITTPVACEHLVGQAMLGKAASTIAHAADKLRSSEFDPDASPSQADAEHSSPQDTFSSAAEPSAFLGSSPQPHCPATPEPGQSRSSEGPTQEVSSNGQPEAVSVARESEELTGHALLRAVKGQTRPSSNSVLDELPSSSDSSSDGALHGTEHQLPDRPEHNMRAKSPSASTSRQQQDVSLTDSVLAHGQQSAPHANGKMHQHSGDGMIDEQTPGSAPDGLPKSARQSRDSQAGSSGLGERSHSSADMTEHALRKSSSSFSDYPEPIRRSFSSPANALNAASDEVLSGTPSSRHPTAATYNGSASKKATLGSGIVTSIQDLGDGWHNTVAQRKPPIFHRGDANAHPDAPSEPAKAPSPFQSDTDAGEAAFDEWLVFEVTDTGCGISAHSLASLFTEYVQGTEDDMKRPRTRGGTGLGLSICSKQVSVLGGLIGAMSKLGEGSTFWFTVPLLRPPPQSRESLSMRRTASWGSRDAFTDGHISRHGASQQVPAGRRTRAATSKAHRSKRYQPKFTQQRTSFSDPDGDQDSSLRKALYADAKDEAARRSSAPEAPAHRRAQQDPSKLRPANSDHQPLPSQRLAEPIRAAAARAALLPESLAPGPSDFSVTSGSDRSSLDRSSLDSIEDLKPAEQHALGLARAPAPELTQQSSGDAQLNGHKPLRYGTIQHNLLSQYKARAAPGHGAAAASGRGGLIALPENATANFTSSSEDSNSSNPSHVGSSSGGQGASDGPSSSASENGRNIRPSMEARRRRLGSSALQGRSVLLAEDNLINQRVAKMMLCSLGMTVQVASNGQEAVEAVRRNAEAVRRNQGRCFDVLLMDMAMPVMGGVDATKEIRKRGHAVPIVAMTANASDKDRDECLEAGMDGFLSKPVLKDRLAEAILSAVSGRRQFQDRGTISLKAYDRL